MRNVISIIAKVIVLLALAVFFYGGPISLAVDGITTGWMHIDLLLILPWAVAGAVGPVLMVYWLD